MKYFKFLVSVILIILFVLSPNIIFGEYFEGRMYEVVGGSFTWYEAKDACENEGGYLVTVTSDEEQLEEQLNDLIRNIKKE